MSEFRIDNLEVDPDVQHIRKLEAELLALRAERDRLVAGIDKLVEQWGADDGAHGSELAALRRTPE